MSDSYAMTFNIKPTSKERPRFNTKTGHAYTPSKTRYFEGYVKSHARVQMLRLQKHMLTGLVGVFVNFNFKRPKKTSLLTPRQDVDNILKGVLDALNGVCYTDDRNVCETYATKQWADENSIKVTIVKL